MLTESNNYFSIIDQLKSAGLIYEHVASNEENPIFIVDRVLTKTTFDDDLIYLIGDEYISYDSVAKEILNITYLFSKYNNKHLKAAEITPEVYRRVFGNEIVAKKYESLGRKIRSFCNRFENSGLLIKGERSAYLFNFEYQGQNKLL